MNDIRWLDIPVGDRESMNHPSAIFIERYKYSVYRVLQILLDDGCWHDVPIVNYVVPVKE